LSRIHYTPPADLLRNFRKEAFRKLDSFIAATIPEKTLYHYTDYAGLQGILSSECLWMTAYQFLSDKSEIKHGLKELNDVIVKYISSFNLKKAWLPLIFPNDPLNYYEIYVCSLCDEKDSSHLWEKYAKEGTGFALGFKKDYFLPVNLVGNKKLNHHTMGGDFLQKRRLFCLHSRTF
jgi:hypothetical protein